MDARHACPGCGALFAPVEGPVHDYMTSSPACWAAFGGVMAREYADPALMPIHRLSVDSWAVQHPGDGSRRAIQSVGLHLARLLVQLEDGLAGDAANERMLVFAARKHELPVLDPPARFAVTVVEVSGCERVADHCAAVRRWAEATWADWAHHHGFIRAWVNGIA